jgi:arylsulfatase A-like enzyme
MFRGLNLLFVFAFCLFPTPRDTNAAEKRPNIVWIFTDDHTCQAIGAYGGPLSTLNPTPNIDRIAKDGMRFDRCYVGNSICAPSRATLLTGKHSHLNGKLDNRGGFNQNQQTFPKLLQKAGYQTVMIGKIHLPGKMQGFDYWEVLPGQGSYYQPTFITETGRTQYKGYVSDVVTDRSLEWLKQSRKDDKPFMLMVHHKATHRTWCPAPRHVGLFDGTTIPEPDSLFDDYSGRGIAAHKQDMTIAKTMRLSTDLKVKTRAQREAKIKAYAKRKGLPRGESGAYYRMTPEHRKIWDAAYDPRNDKFLAANLTGKDLVRWKYQRYIKDYLRSAKAVDEGIGRILDYLDASGLSKNTIVMYCSDQGFYLGEHGWFDKRFMYEESFRTPLIVRWPGVTKAGSVNNDLVQNIDFAETFLDLAKAPIPDDMQGKSLVPLLRHKTPQDWRTSLYYHYYEYPAVHSVRRHEGVAEKQHKLIRFYGRDVPGKEEWELYDLKTDPHEMKNEVANPKYTAKVTQLKAELQRLRKHYKVPDNHQ